MQKMENFIERKSFQLKLNRNKQPFIFYVQAANKKSSFVFHVRQFLRLSFTLLVLFALYIFKYCASTPTVL